MPQVSAADLDDIFKGDEEFTDEIVFTAIADQPKISGYLITRYIDTLETDNRISVFAIPTAKLPEGVALKQDVAVGGEKYQIKSIQRGQSGITELELNK